MERHFDQQLDKLKTKIIKMCSLVDEQVEFVIKALEEENKELAQLVIERDTKVDKFDLKIDKICQKIFALNQPVAMDLRLIMSALTINSNLERIGDITVNIADSFLIAGRKPAFYPRLKIFEMSKIVKEMIKNAIDSFIDNNASLAKKVIETDDLLDEMNRYNHKVLIEIMKEDKNNIEEAVSYLVITRMLERMGDHATNIAEDVYFIVEAQMIKHNYEKFIFNGNEKEDDED
ncbi:MAG: phosphate signaling complex protein PhoU [Ignavibacteriaceae bacterium]|nr:phosphate signaling complex protein PhoU [Ignavibacteriaceae bacterium]HRI47275.1 phosphate signaling complex protein PhoU [Ignavibacteriaceae bacterium]